MNVYCKPLVFTDDKGNSGIKPKFMTKFAACADVAIPYDIKIEAGKIKKFDLLLGFDISAGFKIVMYPRSSLLIKHSLMSPTSIIDSDYSGQHVYWPVVNLSGDDVLLEAGTRVAQIEVQPCTEVDQWERDKTLRTGGFGSTGK